MTLRAPTTTGTKDSKDAMGTKDQPYKWSTLHGFTFVLGILCVLSGGSASAQPTRLAVLQAEDRRAPTANDLAVLRAGAHSADPQTTRIAVRALGRLERPTLIPDITPFLRNALPEIRSEAANAIGQRLGLVDFSPDFSRLLRYGRAVDITRLREEVGFYPRHTSGGAVDDYVASRQAAAAA